MFERILESSEATRIDAPAAVVWEVLTDAKSYGEWNPFTTRLETDFQVGSPIHMHIVMGPYSMDRKEWVRTVEPPCRLEWDTKVLARFLLYSSKEQRVTALTEASCSYQTTDLFSGLLTPLIMLLFRKLIVTGFDETAEALKRRSEAFHGVSQV
ncbi:MAG: SRPBCC domain-containing protein [Gammaproteobacteria bacterium]|nr:SRPBCC domain-containing protein [Gammaproteobacteria bacterium]MDE0367237.1 SRPBCC domain-containing protein [Gammaproteobacteria bacterium]